MTHFFLTCLIELIRTLSAAIKYALTRLSFLQLMENSSGGSLREIWGFGLYFQVSLLLDEYFKHGKGMDVVL